MHASYDDSGACARVRVLSLSLSLPYIQPRQELGAGNNKSNAFGYPELARAHAIESKSIQMLLLLLIARIEPLYPYPMLGVCGPGSHLLALARGRW